MSKFQQAYAIIAILHFSKALYLTVLLIFILTIFLFFFVPICSPGVAPPSFVAIRAGTMLYQLSHAGDAVSWTSVIILAVLAVISILPAVFKQRLREKFD